MSNYRSRLTELEMDVNQSRGSSWGLKINPIYGLVIVVWLATLILFTPSFLYLPKQKKVARKKAWVYIILSWIALSLLTIGALYFFWSM